MSVAGDRIREQLVEIDNEIAPLAGLIATQRDRYNQLLPKVKAGDKKAEREIVDVDREWTRLSARGQELNQRRVLLSKQLSEAEWTPQPGRWVQG